MKPLSVLLFLLISAMIEALTTLPSFQKSTSALTVHRRSFLETLAATAATAATVPSIALALDDDNVFIQQLKARSEGKQYAKEDGSVSWDKLSSSKFSQQYDRPSFLGVKRGDGSVQMLDAAEVNELEAQGKIVAEYQTYVDKQGKLQTDYMNGKVYRYVQGDEPQ